MNEVGVNNMKYSMEYTFSATGWGPVPEPIMSMAVPAHTSPNAPRPNNL